MTQQKKIHKVSLRSLSSHLGPKKVTLLQHICSTRAVRGCAQTPRPSHDTDKAKSRKGAAADPTMVHRERPTDSGTGERDEVGCSELETGWAALRVKSRADAGNLPWR